MKYSVFDDEFKKMTVELSKVKGSVKELDFDPSMLSKWHNKPEFNGGRIMMNLL